MRCFTVGTKIVDHIEIELEPYPHVPVGEEGRGRKLTRFPLGQKFAEGLESFRETDYSRLITIAKNASIIKTKEKGTLLMVEERDPNDKRVIALVAIHGGYRGRTRWFEYDYVNNCEGKEICEDNNYDKLIVLAEGYGAEGAAGRAGGPHYERLLIMDIGACFKIERYGRLYGNPSEYIVFYDGEQIRVGTKDEIFEPSCEMPEGELI